MKTPIDLFESKTINVGVETLLESPIIPNGKKVTIRVFGGCSGRPADGIDANFLLKFGAGNFRAGCVQFNYEVAKVFDGDGVSKIQVLSELPTGAIGRRASVWLEGFYE